MNTFFCNPSYPIIFESAPFFGEVTDNCSSGYEFINSADELYEYVFPHSLVIENGKGKQLTDLCREAHL